MIEKIATNSIIVLTLELNRHEARAASSRGTAPKTAGVKGGNLTYLHIQMRHDVDPPVTASGDFGDDVPREDRPGFFDASDDDRINAKAAAVMVQGEAGHQQQQKKIGPRPFARGTVKTEPEIGDLQRADQAAQPDKQA